MLVSAKMIGKTVDSLSQKRDLNLGRTSVSRVGLELRNDCLFLLALKRHTQGSLSGKPPLETQKIRSYEHSIPRVYHWTFDSDIGADCAVYFE